MASTFSDDLDVAAAALRAADEHHLIARDRAPGQTLARRRAPTATMPMLDRLDHAIDEKFDLLIELITDHSFVAAARPSPISPIIKYASIAMTSAGAAAGGAASRCSCAAASCGRCAPRPAVADRIASGELQTAIPPGGADETGALLKSMTVMQDNIREAMTREKTLRRSAENRLVGRAGDQRAKA